MNFDLRHVPGKSDCRVVQEFNYVGTAFDAYGVLNGSVRSGINIDMLVESDDKSLPIRRPFDEICDFFDVGDICTSTFD